MERGLRALLDGPAAGKDAPGAQADGGPAAMAPAPGPGEPVLSAKAIKAHPAVAALDAALEKNRRISYLPARAFGTAVLDLLAPPAALLADRVDADRLSPAARDALAEIRHRPERASVEAFVAALPSQDTANRAIATDLLAAVDRDPLERARAALVGLPADHPARRTLLRLLDDAEGSRDTFRTSVENWFDEQMDRISGWYKRRVQRWIIAYGVALTILFNVDTVAVAQSLWRAPTERASAAAVATAAADRDINSVDTSLDALRGLEVPIGWTAPHQHNAVSRDPRHVPATVPEGLLKLLGWLITAGALAFGAPFWFDALGKLTRQRNTGDKPKPTT